MKMSEYEPIPAQSLWQMDPVREDRPLPLKEVDRTLVFTETTGQIFPVLSDIIRKLDSCIIDE